MAASIYATPPPDLNSEDTALSDVSNASSLNNHNHNHNHNHHLSNANKSPLNEAPTTTISTTENQKSSNINILPDKPNANYELDQEQTQKQPPALKPLEVTMPMPVPESADEESNVNRETVSNVSPLHEADTHSPSAAIAAVAAAANAAMQLQLLEAINDAAKKRRKQHNPSRLGAVNLTSTAADIDASNSDVVESTSSNNKMGKDEQQIQTPAISIDYDEKLSKMFLPKTMEHLKETFELLQKQQQQLLQEEETERDVSERHTNTETQQNTENISTTAYAPETNCPQLDSNITSTTFEDERNKQESEPDISRNQTAVDDEFKNPYQTFCKQCGENFENEFKLGLHLLQEHSNNSEGGENNNSENPLSKSMTPFDILTSAKIKLERTDYENSSSPQSNPTACPQGESTSSLGNGKEQWMNSIPGMTFPFPPEAAAAAALSASGYLPLLGVHGFPNMDGLNRPPLRIFNPEAYCDLCNKEFCNKYFLKTHKANKHGIYDPAISSSGESSNSNPSLSTMNQVFQLQMQQQQQQLQMQQHQQLQQQQQQQQKPPNMSMEFQQTQTTVDSQRKQPPPSQAQTSSLNIQQPVTPPAPPPVYCDVCSKRFTNVFAMRRHRAKAHEQSSTQRNSSPEQPLLGTKTDTTTSKQDYKIDSMSSKFTNDSTAKQFQMPEGFRQDFTLEQEEVSFTPQPRKLSPQSQQQARDANFAHDKLKRLGVLNPEAFCEICCKEYCNKYFLRTHKWKRHGIFMPPDDLKDEQPTLAQKMPWPFINMPNMPLNLMMANDKAIAAQRMLAAAAITNNVAPSEDSGPLLKRIKLEMQDEDEYKTHETPSDIFEPHNDVANHPTSQATSIPSTPEPHKNHPEAGDIGLNVANSPETAVGLQNLQKLQSMIQQLSDLNGKRPVICQLCGRELENQYALHAHMMTEHNAPLDNGNPMLPLNFQQHILQQQQALKLSPVDSTNSIPLPTDLRCNQCDRDFSTIAEFKQHIAEVHILSNSPLREGFMTPERPINSSSANTSRPPYTITPTSSYCEICNKELCNKYFMKTHMQRMHGIEIENGAQIGGVVCNICNKELCSKYFLRVHKHNTHGIVEEGSPLPQPRQNGMNLDTQQQQQPLPQHTPQHTDAEVPRSLNVSPFGNGLGMSSESKSESSDVRYYANYTEICPICTRRFRSSKWLRAHLISDHGSLGAEKMRELEQQLDTSSKPNSPTLKIPNGSSVGGSSVGTGISSASLVHNPVNLAQALQNLNAQHLLSNMSKNALPGMFESLTEQTLPSPRFKEYQCSLCPFTTPYYAFLFIHERSHSILNNNGELPPVEITNSSNNAITSEYLKNSMTQLEHVNPDSRDKQQQISSDNTNIEFASKDSCEPANLSTKTATPTEKSVNESKTQRTHKEEHNSMNDKQNIAHPITIEKDKDLSIEAKTDKTDRTFKLDNKRSISTSPIISSKNTSTQDILKDIANKFEKPACYAIPKDTLNSTAHHMQPFIVESIPDIPTSTEGNNHINRFVPAIIYLPVRENVSESITVTFKLTPA